ncbi:GTP cyclohydrolase [Oceanihabitans sp. 2_MG-2023]|uniref:GTP cyclohydrolase n=1 Tax=Oceanihabitans sp. 2_MG-2023 TaxID=3062661 RepID=UPI0026E1904A|nr:GTP cyclohydrolase [Oceanihabitans sp. 2_MG-2023]MDO6598007.1 GTP cyclohydrolase [Oceanihabitans sp. 2_MG-2023]
MITIKQVHTKKELKAFVKFPFQLYKNSKYWVPPIISQELKTFDKKENPVFNDADAYFFLAYKGDEIVGRVAAIINWLEVNNQNEKKMRFGWFDFVDDLDVSKALLDKVAEIGKQNNLEYTEGPVGFSNLDKVGVLTEGYDVIGTMITWYNHPYYVTHLEKHNYLPEKEWIESSFPFGNIDPTSFTKANDLIKKRYKVKARNFTQTKEVMPYVDEMFNLFNTSYASLSSFVEITDIQKAYFKKKFISFINPEFIKFVFDKDDKMIAFAIVMPSFSKVLQEINGKLFPFGFLKLLKAKRESKDVIFYLIGIAPEYQNKGITAIIFNECYKTFDALGIENCIRTPELANNIAIQQIWKHFNPKIIKRRKTFKKVIQ